MNSRMHVHTNVGMMTCTMLAIQLLLCMHIVRGKDTLCPFKRFASSSFPHVWIISMQENSRVSCLGGCITQNRICMRATLMRIIYVHKFVSFARWLWKVCKPPFLVSMPRLS